MPFGQPVLDTVTTQPSRTTKLSNNNYNKRQRERQTERQSWFLDFKRETDRQTDRETERQTDRLTETEREHLYGPTSSHVPFKTTFFLIIKKAFIDQSRHVVINTEGEEGTGKSRMRKDNWVTKNAASNRLRVFHAMCVALMIKRWNLPI